MNEKISREVKNTKIIPLKEAGVLKSGGTPSKNNNNYWGGNFPWITAKDLKVPVLENSIDRLTDEGTNHAKIAPKNSLLILVRGMTLFKDVPVCLAGRDLAFNQDIKALIPKKDVDPNYLLMFLKSKKRELLGLVDSAGHGTGRLNIDLLENLNIAIPPIPEQKAIADLLSTWDEAIEKTERLIRAKEQRLDAYGRELFNRKNACNYKGWKSIRLKDVLIEHGDKSTGNEEVYSVSVHKGLVNQIEHLGRSFSASNTENYNCAHYGDIVYTKSPTGNFPLGVVKQSYVSKDVIVSPLYGVFTPKSFHLGIVIDFYFSSPTRARNYLYSLIQKGAKNTLAITNKTFISKKLHLPVDETAQKAIAEYVITAREEIDLLKQLADKYKIQKSGLMQKMLTGTWRIKLEIINKYR
ncbi:type I restriction enzyme S subunit [Hydrogenispora ethanolica]|uniref:Type I restriction enzyme S subunit n=1 Tax=Hydrogenispora ethanolica TaxID=1082276 RepID=A0A4R1RA30_HYDET|nr:restriction endonuclease subunit S [Hydrogenispora ethanolica]TCL62593.1 type I restriction enzyme S subunit [Hydrogenispora ethanolica]